MKIALLLILRGLTDSRGVQEVLLKPPSKPISDQKVRQYHDDLSPI